MGIGNLGEQGAVAAHLQNGVCVSEGRLARSASRPLPNRLSRNPKPGLGIRMDLPNLRDRSVFHG